MSESDVIPARHRVRRLLLTIKVGVLWLLMFEELASQLRDGTDPGPARRLNERA